MDHNGIVAYRVVIPDALIDVLQGEYLLFVRSKQMQNLVLRMGQRNGLTVFYDRLAVGESE